MNQLWDDYCQYLYLPRLVRREVLERAISDGAASLSWTTDTFAYADTHDGSKYGGLVGASQLSAVAPSGMVVKPDVAQVQLNADQDAQQGGADGLGTPGDVGAKDAVGEGSGAEGASPGAGLPSRYYGRITLDSIRWTRQVADIAEAVVNQIAKAPDAKLRITIEADAESGFTDGIQRTVTENAAVLKFDASEFERE